eukprot:2061076-Amphidinium_carterae.1
MDQLRKSSSFRAWSMKAATCQTLPHCHQVGTNFSMVHSTARAGHVLSCNAVKMRSHIRSSGGVLASCLDARCCAKGTWRVLASLPLWRSPRLRGLPC